jgi:hypothetical protein
MVEALEKGFHASPRYTPLRKMASEVGLRRKSVLPFLPRENALNKTLGKIRFKMEKARQKREEETAAAAEPKAPQPSAAGHPAAGAPRSPGARRSQPSSRRPSKG